MRCGYPGCDREQHARGWCTLHYQRAKRHGDPSVVLPRGLGPTDPATCSTCYDVEFMAGTDTAAGISARVGFRGPDDNALREALMRHLRRHGRTDLVAELQRHEARRRERAYT